MRLIDADALKAIYENWLPQLNKMEDEGNKRGVINCIAVLDAAPTIEAELVRHGRWIPDLASLDDANNMLCTCSCCGNSDLSAITVVVPYCWYCGAKMDLEG